MKKCSIKYLLVLALFALVPCAFGATYYVSTTGIDANDGLSWESPITMTSALALALASDDTTELLLAEGTHKIKNGYYTINKPVIIRGVSDDISKVILTTSDSQWGIRFTMSHSQAILSSLTFHGGKIDGSGKKGACIEFPESNSGGMITNCIVRAGWFNTNYSNFGGGVALLGAGLVSHCVISNNATQNSCGGAGVYMCHSNAVVRNCLITGNYQGTRWGVTTNKTSSTAFGAGVRISSGLLESCTIAGNMANQCAGVFAEYNSKLAAPIIRNCLIADNISYATENIGDISCSDSIAPFEYCAAPAAINNGVACAVVVDPFVDVSSKDYRPKPSNLIVDAGLNQDWMSGAVDLAGNSRISTANQDLGKKQIVDIGAYEVEDVPKASVSATFSVVSATRGFGPLKVQFVAYPQNFGDEADISYVWNFGDGSDEKTVVGTSSVTHEYTESIDALVKVTVENKKETRITAESTISIEIVPEKLYVSENGLNVSPYDTPENGSPDFKTVFDLAMDGCEIVVLKGSYVVASECTVDKAITIRGATGNPKDVIIQRDRASSANHRIFTINSEGATLSGVTVQNGKLGGGGDGGNISLSAGIVSNCIIRAGTVTGGNNDGSAVYLGNGGMAILTHCIIRENTADCSDYVSMATNGRGAAVVLHGNKVFMRNCLIVENTQGALHIWTAGLVPTFSHGAVSVHSGTVESCTIAKNKGRHCAGISRANAGKVINCLIYGNESLQDPDYPTYDNYDYAGTASAFTYCAAPTVIGGEGCIALTKNPFKNAANGDYRLVADSEVKDKGLFQAWMIGAIDLAGNPRLDKIKVVEGVETGSPDIGCYELGVAQGFSIIMR